mmetsp:Transcript_85250/g.135113  ORF Transcript_85250/g.135113 Transcript_85250/m.135113 type:complete len:133 (+) Transcript_85250:517-915(+)
MVCADMGSWLSAADPAGSEAAQSTGFGACELLDGKPREFACEEVQADFSTVEGGPSDGDCRAKPCCVKAFHKLCGISQDAAQNIDGKGERKEGLPGDAQLAGRWSSYFCTEECGFSGSKASKVLESMFSAVA